MSKWKQAFGIGIPNKLLVREYECCCFFCINRQFGGCKNKEYVQPPTAIELVPQSQYHQPVTRSQVIHQPSFTAAARVQVGSFYVVVSDKNNEGFLFVKCKFVNVDTLDAYMLEMVSIDESKNTQLYRLTDVAENFSLESVHSILVSISLKNLNSHMYSVDINEVEDIILSLEN